MAIVSNLAVTEALIAAHKAAKLGGDRTTIRLIELALRHVGHNLAIESLYAGDEPVDREVGRRRNNGRRKVSLN